MHAQIARRAKHIITLLGRKSTQEAHRQQDPASGYRGQYSRNLCTEGGRKQRNGNAWGRERSTYTHAHTCTHSASDGSLVHKGPSHNPPACLAQSSICCTLSATYTSFSPCKAQTYLQFQIHLPSSERHTKQVNLTLTHRSRWSFWAVCIAEDGFRPEAAGRCERAFSVPRRDVVKSTPTIKVGPQERPKW